MLWLLSVYLGMTRMFRMFRIILNVTESSIYVLSPIVSGSLPEMRRDLVRIDRLKSIFSLSFSSLRWTIVSLSRDGIVRRVGLANKIEIWFPFLTLTSVLSTGKRLPSVEGLHIVSPIPWEND